LTIEITTFFIVLKITPEVDHVYPDGKISQKCKAMLAENVNGQMGDAFEFDAFGYVAGDLKKRRPGDIVNLKWSPKQREWEGKQIKSFTAIRVMDYIDKNKPVEPGQAQAQERQ